MNHQGIEKKLPALEYCTIDRASRLLDCEVSDLTHWWLIGLIEMYTFFDGLDVTVKRSQKYIANEDNKGDSAFLKYDEWPFSVLHDRKKISSERWHNEKSDQIQEVIEFTGQAYGLWKVLPARVTVFLNDNNISLIAKGSLSEHDKKVNAAIVKHAKENEFVEFDQPVTVSINDLFITKKCINGLDSNINGGEKASIGWLPGLKNSSVSEDELTYIVRSY